MSFQIRKRLPLAVLLIFLIIITPPALGQTLRKGWKTKDAAWLAKDRLYAEKENSLKWRARDVKWKKRDAKRVTSDFDSARAWKIRENDFKLYDGS